MTAGLVLEWLGAGQLQLPLPGSGRTAQRWRRLSELTAVDVVAGRLAEAHTDAVAILAELGGRAPRANELWGVWAAEGADSAVTARGAGDALVLDGTKAWCSGAGLCTHALVTAHLGDGRRGLFAVGVHSPAVRPMEATWRNAGMADSDTRSVQFSSAPAVLLGDGRRGLFAVGVHSPAVRPMEATWRNAGMADSDTRSVQFSSAPAVPVGQPDDYLNRPGFWFGAIGGAACWLGGARAVTAPLYQRAARGSADDHLLAHLGAVDAAITAAEATLAGD